MRPPKPYNEHPVLSTTTQKFLKMTPGNLLDNYIYIYHLPGDSNSNQEIGKFVVIPTYPE
jgi:hypothetical protein